MVLYGVVLLGLINVHFVYFVYMRVSTHMTWANDERTGHTTLPLGAPAVHVFSQFLNENGTEI